MVRRVERGGVVKAKEDGEGEVRKRGKKGYKNKNRYEMEIRDGTECSQYYLR